jgi:PBS lyase HEAT-like repeat
MVRRFGLAALILALSGAGLTPTGAADKSKAPVASPEAAAKALKALERPPSDGKPDPRGNGPVGGWSEKEALIHGSHATCRDAIDLLVRTEVAVDKDLLALAETTKLLHVRYRTVYILAQRRNSAVVPLLDKMCLSEDVNERYVSWKTYQRALQEQRLPPPKDVAQHLAMYEKEPDNEVRESMEWFFGAAKAKAAVKPLLASMQRHPGWATAAIWSLGMIGDKSAAPAIIADFRESGNRHYHLEALGRLATPESVDFIIDHLSEDKAVDALTQSGSKKALPALQRRLEKLQREKGDLAATRIAIIRLSHEDCRDALLKIAEDRQENHRARWYAFKAIQEYDTDSYTRRILDVYKVDPDADIKRICIWLLEDRKAEGITEAMMDHVLQVAKVEDKNDLATEYALQEALNKRLGTFFGDMEKLQAHVRELRKK